MSPHEPPYRFCINGYQKIPLELFGVPPMSSPPPPLPLTQCVSLRCPTNLVKWTRGERVPVEFAVEARSACGTNVAVTCIPPSGSVLPVGLTYVHCYAADELGNSARCRFPVFVYGTEPSVRIDRNPAAACCAGLLILTTGSCRAVAT